MSAAERNTPGRVPQINTRRYAATAAQLAQAAAMVQAMGASTSEAARHLRAFEAALQRLQAPRRRP